MVNQQENQQRLFTIAGQQFQQAQEAQTLQPRPNTELVIDAIGTSAQAHQRHLDTMGQVNQLLRGSVSNLEQAAAAMAGATAGIGPQIMTAMGQMSGQLGQGVSTAMANQPPPPASIAT